LLPPDEGLSVPELIDLAVLAERSGYTTVATGEVSGPESFSLLGMVAASTNHVTIGTGVIAMATRSVPLAAMGFATLSSMRPGRVFAGVGASSQTVVKRWHGREYPRASTHVREYVPALRSALRGERLDLAGEYVRSSGFQLRIPAPDVPIVLGAMNPKMLQTAGEIADGVFLAWCSVEDAAEKVALVRRGAERAGKDPASIQVFSSLHAYAGSDTARVIERLRREVLSYATVPTHQPSFAKVLPSLALIDALWASGDRKAALAEVSDEAVLALTAVGDADAVAARVQEYWDVGVDCPVLLTLGSLRGVARELRATVVDTAQKLGLDGR
jgi:probable F420-dependent oxidoreductase